MDWITDDIAIGNFLDAENAELRREQGIRSMLCLSGKQRGIAAEALGLVALENFELKDGPGNDPRIFQRAVESVGLLAKLHPKLLVQCHAGRSRSVVVVAAHLMKTRRWTSEEALRYVSARREAALTPGIEQLLCSNFLH